MFSQQSSGRLCSIFCRVLIRRCQDFNLQYSFLLSLMKAWVRRSAIWILAPLLSDGVDTQGNLSQRTEHSADPQGVVRASVVKAVWLHKLLQSDPRLESLFPSITKGLWLPLQPSPVWADCLFQLFIGAEVGGVEDVNVLKWWTTKWCGVPRNSDIQPFPSFLCPVTNSCWFDPVFLNLFPTVGLHYHWPRLGH